MQNNNQQKINYDKLMQEELEKICKGNVKPTLILHSCCAPCSSYVLRLLQKYFHITVFFYNSNLYPSKEFKKRLKEQKKLIRILNRTCKKNYKKGLYNGTFYETPIKIIKGKYVSKEFYNYIKGHEGQPEGGSRCYLCYNLRLLKTAEFAKNNGFNYFCTTLTVSPYKNATWINEIGKLAQEQYGVPFLHSDFKKNDGYKKSIEYSKEFKLYRQDYCGCEFSFKAKHNH